MARDAFDKAANAATLINVGLFALFSTFPRAEAAYVGFIVGAFIWATFFDTALSMLLIPGFAAKMMPGDFAAGVLIPWWLGLLIAAPYPVLMHILDAQAMKSVIRDPEGDGERLIDAEREIYKGEPYGTWRRLRLAYATFPPVVRTHLRLLTIVAVPGSAPFTMAVLFSCLLSVGLGLIYVAFDIVAAAVAYIVLMLVLISGWRWLGLGLGLCALVAFCFLGPLE